MSCSDNKRGGISSDEILVLSVSTNEKEGCSTHEGYARYRLRIGCDRVMISGLSYIISSLESTQGSITHEIVRGISRESIPWLYVHEIGDDVVDITFETDMGKSIYPLSTGSSASIFLVYKQSWHMTKSTNASFNNDIWLVSHRWSEKGIYFDMQQRTGTEKEWLLLKADIFVPANGREVYIEEIGSSVEIESFDFTNENAMVLFQEVE